MPRPNHNPPTTRRSCASVDHLCNQAETRRTLVSLQPRMSLLPPVDSRSPLFIHWARQAGAKIARHLNANGISQDGRVTTRSWSSVKQSRCSTPWPKCSSRAMPRAQQCCDASRRPHPCSPHPGNQTKPGTMPAAVKRSRLRASLRMIAPHTTQMEAVRHNQPIKRNASRRDRPSQGKLAMPSSQSAPMLRKSRSWATTCCVATSHAISAIWRDKLHGAHATLSESPPGSLIERLW